MPACSVTYCLNRTEYGCRLFVLPQGQRNKERRDIWLKNINRDDLPANVYLCEDHFENDQFENNRKDGKRPLKKTAIPTLFNVAHDSAKAPATNLNEKKIKQELDSTEDIKEEVKGDTSGDAADNSEEGLRRSKRVRKPIKFEEYVGLDEERETTRNSVTNKPDESTEEETENVQRVERKRKRHPQRRLPKSTVGLLRCRTCLTVTAKEMSHMLKEMLLGKTIKEIISICAPEISDALLGVEYICNKCYRFLVKLMLFTDSCIESTLKLGSGEVSLEYNGEDETEVDGNNKVTVSEETTPSKQGSKRKQDLSNISRSEDGEELDETQKPIEPPKKRGRKRKHPIETEGNSGKDVSKNKEGEVVIPNNTQNSSVLDENAEASDQGGTDDFSITAMDADKINETNSTDSPTPDEQSNVIFVDHNYTPESAEYLLRCPSCLMDYKTLRGIKSHLTLSHGIQEEYNVACSLCNMKFIRFKDLIRHRKSQHGHPCHICERVFGVRSELDTHIQTHTEKFCCIKCGAKFKKEDELNKHLPLHIWMSKVREWWGKVSEKQPTLECSHCSLKFMTTVKLQHHINTIHLKIKPFKCEECQKKYSSRATLNAHFRLHHSTDTMLPHVCEECGSSFKQKESLDHHAELHLATTIFQSPHLKTYSKSFNASERDYRCVFCIFKTKTKEELISHLRIHANNRKSFECAYCGLKLSSERTKTAHEKTHEDPNNQHVCSTCWKRFPTEEKLKDHEDQHDLLTKKFSCSLCGCQYFRQIQLENHILDVHVETIQSEIHALDNDKRLKLELIEQNKRAVAMDWSTDEEEEEELGEEALEPITSNEKAKEQNAEQEEMVETDMGMKITVVKNADTDTDNDDEEVIEIGEEELKNVVDADEIYVRGIIKRHKRAQIEKENVGISEVEQDESESIKTNESMQKQTKSVTEKDEQQTLLAETAYDTATPNLEKSINCESQYK